MENYIKIARPDHWIKNLFLFPGAFFALFFVDYSFRAELLFRLLLAFAATCLLSSANYVINEWLDAGTDRYHPVKKNRPAVTGHLNPRLIWPEYGLLAAAGLALSLTENLPFFLTGAALLFMGGVYNVRPVRAKDLPYLDVITESVNNALRLLLGWFAVTAEFYPPVSLIVGFWTGGAFLMAMKRFAEYRMIGDPAVAALYRRSFRKYTERSLLISSFFYAMCSVFFIGVFLVKYRIELILAMPPLCGLFCLYFFISFKKDSAVQKPEKLYREKFLMAYVMAFLVLVILLMFVDIPQLSGLLDTTPVRVG